MIKFSSFNMEENKIWSEKYRPASFKEFKGQDKIAERVKAFVKQKNIPHMMFAGPAGTGKTTMALLVARELFKDSWRDNTLETNASDSRGIDVVRESIKTFARTKSVNSDLPKLIFLDECDALTKEAQNALRRTMEIYSDNCRFILSCNFSSKLIDPIQSRCAVFRFKPLEEKDIKEIIKEIAKREDLTVDDSAMQALAEICEGDARKVQNLMQSCAAVNKNITEDLVYEIVSYARPEEIKEVLKIAIKGEFIKARDMLLDIILKYGLSGLDIVKQIQKAIWELEIKEETKIKLIEKCGEVEFRIVEGSDEFVQLESLLASFILAK